MLKILTMFISFSTASLALPGMSGFVTEFTIFFEIITSLKCLLIPKILIPFLMAIGTILTPIYYHYLCYARSSMDTSYLMLKMLLFFFLTARIICFDLSFFTGNRSWYLPRFCSFIIR